MRFYEFEKGEILIDGVSIKQYNMNELRQKMGLVLQDAFLFYGTIKDNIRLHNEELTDEDIIEAAKFVQANKFIEKLPDGYNQQVTERGSTFLQWSAAIACICPNNGNKSKNINFG